MFDIFDELVRDLDRELFEEFEDIQRRVSQHLREIEEDLSKHGGRGFVYGLRITIGPDGVPRVERFGNVRRPARERVREARYSEEIEPLVDIYEDSESVTVVAEIPGAEKDKIKVRAEGRNLIIEASNGRRYRKEVELPAEVDMDTAKASYKNGVLEIKIRKRKEQGPVKEIKIE